MGMGVTVAMFMFMYTAFLVPIQAEIDVHDNLPAHREAAQIIDGFDDDIVEIKTLIHANTESTQILSDKVLLLNEKVSNIQQNLP